MKGSHVADVVYASFLRLRLLRAQLALMTTYDGEANSRPFVPAFPPPFLSHQCLTSPYHAQTNLSHPGSRR